MTIGPPEYGAVIGAGQADRAGRPGDNLTTNRSVEAIVGLEQQILPLTAITPNPRNTKRHPPEQIEKLALSFRQFGQTMPLLVDETGMLIAGEGRWLALQSMGATEARVVIARDWPEDKRRAYMVLDNALPELGEWDDAALKLELGDLRFLGYDLENLGFTSDHIATLLDARPSGASDPEAPVELPANPVARLGDIWQLGRHRLACGNSCDPDVVRALLGDERPNVMLTDPPYGVNYDPDWRNRAMRPDGGPRYGARAIGVVHNDDRADWLEAWEQFPGSIAYVWCASLTNDVVVHSLEAAGFKRRSLIIWNKQHFQFSRGDYHWKHETCWYAVRGTGDWCGDRSQTTVWDIQNHNPHGGTREEVEETTGHSTQKPIECMKRPMLNNTRAGESVYDPFVGSGTTIMAAEITGRRCYAIELDPAYVDVAVTRWEAYTGEHAICVRDGVEIERPET